jgi:hypothetical protein
MKTAIQEMLEWTRSTFPMDLDTPRMIEDKIKSLIKKEKEQIMDAYWQGAEDIINTDMTLGEQFEEYYKEFYINK